MTTKRTAPQTIYYSKATKVPPTLVECSKGIDDRSVLGVSNDNEVIITNLLRLVGELETFMWGPCNEKSAPAEEPAMGFAERLKQQGADLQIVYNRLDYIREKLEGNL